MPLPIRANQARLTIDGRTYELRDVHARQDDSIELDRVTRYDGGRTMARTVGRLTSRVVIEAEVIPEPAIGRTSDEVSYEVTQRITYADPQPLTGLDRLTERVTEFIEAKKTAPQKPAPRSRWDRLLDDHPIC